ncbi:MAG: hypothetical protein H6Q61_880 [Firmicutes bacterium]|nr:hypothetical protein [Bacillota bacterium]
MDIKKHALAGLVSGEAAAPASELEALNRFTKTPLTQEQVYLFQVRLCDNQVDRDGECFSHASLEQLAPLFVGKTGIFDHSWSARDQAARIYRTEVCAEPGIVPETGECASFLKGYAYMLRNEENAPLIADIEAGIKKEVSVSCAVARRVCSLCGNDMGSEGTCRHVKGKLYDGKRCAAILQDPTDAFEWSFVAVPAQRNAGVIKAMERRNAAQKGQSEAYWMEQLHQLEKEAEQGRRYLENLREEVLRLALLARDGLEKSTISGIVKKLEENELLQMKAVYEAAAGKRLPLQTQLRYTTEKTSNSGDDGAFRI